MIKYIKQCPFAETGIIIFFCSLCKSNILFSFLLNIKALIKGSEKRPNHSFPKEKLTFPQDKKVPRQDPVSAVLSCLSD